MSNEVDLLENSIGEIVSTNAFLSTILNRQVANMFLESVDRSNQQSRVLFIIDADPSLQQTENRKPLPDESEVLFMAGSVFRLKKIYRDPNGIRIVELDWCNEVDQDVQISLRNIKKNRKIDHRAFGNMLLDMGKPEAVEQHLLLSLSSSPEIQSSLRQTYISLNQIEELRRNDAMRAH